MNDDTRASMRFDIAREERRGSRRVNQDRAGHAETDAAVLLVVADGMGGYARGELAAEVAVDTLCEAFREQAAPTLADPGDFLHRSLAAAHRAIRDEAAARGLREAPRTVAVACVVQDGRAWWNHVGDSRFYLVRDGQVAARTRDHTHVQALLDAGKIDEDGVSSHPDRNHVLQSLGAPDEPEIGAGASAPLRDDDLLLLCSDGFWGPVRTGQLLRGLEVQPLQLAISELSDLAERRAGAHADNLTVLAMGWRDGRASTTP